MAPTCIIAEHDPWEIRLLRMHLERLGFRPVQAFDGQDTLRLASAERPDVIVLDADLPGLPNGADLLHALKQDRRTRSIPVIWLSWQDGVNPDAGAASPNSYLKKPATYETFELALAQAGVRVEQE
jgi:CheY-like chemotaxis protein